MRVRTKLLLMFLASSAFLFVEGLAAAWSLRRVGGEVAGLQRYTQTDDLCGQIKAEAARLPSPDALAKEPTRARLVLLEHADKAIVLCRGLDRLASTGGSRDAAARALAAVTAYRTAGLAYADASEAGRAGFREVDASTQAWRAVEQVHGVIEPVGHEARLAVQSVVRRTRVLDRWVTLGGLAFALVLTVVGAIVLARITAQPLVRLVRAAREVGRGRLDTHVDVQTSDELGELAGAFNEMTRQLRAVYAGLEAEVEKRTAELRQREQELERARRLAAVGRLAAGVAHEVSNPLTVIAGAAEGLRDRARDPALKDVPAFADFPEYLEQIEGEAYRLKKVIRRLLDLSRPRTAALERVDLARIAHDAVALARLDRRAKEHPVRLEEAAAELPVRGDQDALQEALLNLLFNALDAVAAGGEVRVRLAAEGGRAVVAIEDTGAGIAPEDLERLFEPFFTTKGEGTGLGLTLVHGTVERHGGTIVVASEGRGRGATVRIALPLAAAETAPGAVDAASAS